MFGRSRVNSMAASDRRGQEEDGIKRFDPRILDRSVIAIPLLEEIKKDEQKENPVRQLVGLEQNKRSRSYGQRL